MARGNSRATSELGTLPARGSKSYAIRNVDTAGRSGRRAIRAMLSSNFDDDEVISQADRVSISSAIPEPGENGEIMVTIFTEPSRADETFERADAIVNAYMPTARGAERPFAVVLAVKDNEGRQLRGKVI